MRPTSRRTSVSRASTPGRRLAMSTARSRSAAKSDVKQRTRIIGVDPGSHKTGWGVIDLDTDAQGRQRVEHVDNGVIFLDDSRDLTVRLVDLSHRLNDRIISFKPDIAVVEDVFVNKGARSALIL